MKAPKKPRTKASHKTHRVPRDGSSFARAILIDQNRWRSQHCPGAELLLQILQPDGGRYCDVLLLELTSGAMRRVYFDVTDLFTAGLNSSNADEGPEERKR
jgi:hypothetical protein